MRSPEFTVVIACRDEVGTLPACLDAIEAQDLPRDRFEVLIVDGGSTDGSKELAEAHGFALLHEGGRGPSAARNLAIHAARGDIVAFTDADCVPRFDWLTRLSEAFRDPHVHGVAGGLRMSRATIVGRLEDNDARLCYAGYITSNVAYRREVLLDVGGFDDTLHCAEDYDLAWRILDAGYRIEHVPEALVLHDPPEVRAHLGSYLRKQFWYARADVGTHLRAIRRKTPAGSALARAGLLDALGRSALTLGVVGGIALRSRVLLAGALGLAVGASARHVSSAIKEIGEGELVRMSAIEAARRLVRGAGTIVGLATPSVWRAAGSRSASGPQGLGTRAGEKILIT